MKRSRRSNSVAGIDRWTPPHWREYLTGGWRRYVRGPDLERVAVFDSYPSVCGGVYFLFDGDELAYVGLSVDVGLRVSNHYVRDRKVFNSYGAIAVPVELLTAVETAYIHALLPPLNQRLGTPSYANHDEMAAAIRAAWNRPA